MKLWGCPHGFPSDYGTYWYAQISDFTFVFIIYLHIIFVFSRKKKVFIASKKVVFQQFHIFLVHFRRQEQVLFIPDYFLCKVVRPS